MIPGRARPVGGRVTGLTIGRETGRSVTRIVGSIVVGFVTRIACGRCIYITRGMTRDALLRQMGAGQRESRSIVIKSGRGPGCGCVTATTDVTEIVGDVPRVGRTVKIGLVTGVTVGWGARIRRSVADIARNSSMGPGQNERHRVSIVGGRETCRRVTVSAHAAESRQDMVRVFPILEVCLVT